MASEKARDAFTELRTRLARSIVGQQALIDRLLVGLLANGHLLVEGLPGLAKTRAIKCLARELDAALSRIQFTPDLLPSDITGTEVYHQIDGRGEFRFEPGPISASLILADEINLAPAKVQAALSEAMEERHVAESIDRYVVELVNATRTPERYDAQLRKWIEVGASPRGAIGLDRCARAHAWLGGRDFVTPDDVRAVAHDVLRHRIILSYEAN